MNRAVFGVGLHRLAGLLVVVFLLAGCQTTHENRLQHVADVPGETETSYRLGTDDRLRIIVFGQDDLSNIYTVDGDGRISMPLVGGMQVAGRTTDEVTGIVASRLKAGFIRNPNVSIEIQSYRPFYILGEVRQPGQYPYASGITAKSAVAIAGGFTERAMRRRVYVTRTVAGETHRALVKADTIVEPGDTIEVSERLF